MARVPVKVRERYQVEDLWSGDRAVLIKVVELHEPTGEDLPSGEVLRQFPAERHDDVQQSLRRLGDNGYIKTVGLPRGDGEVQFLRIKGVTEKGLRASSAWPEEAELLADRIMEVLAERATSEPDPEKRSIYRTAVGMSRDLFVDVVGTALARLMPGG